MVPLLMSLLQYFERADVLPDPRGTLSTSLPPRAIARANAEVRRSLDEGNSMKARRSYHRYSPKVRAAIGKYASTNGVSAASRFFSGKLKHHVSTSTVLSIKKSYMEERKRREREGGGYGEVQQLPWRPRGRPLLLGDVDSKVQAYLKKSEGKWRCCKQQDCDVSCSGSAVAFQSIIVEGKWWSRGVEQELGAVASGKNEIC